MPWTFSYPIPIWRARGGYSVSGRTRSTGGNGANGTATVSGGSVTGIASTNSGTGYTTPPVVTISGGGGTGATAEAVLTNGEVTGYVITNPGTGYTSAPTVTVEAIEVAIGVGGPQLIFTSEFGPAPIQLSASYNLANTGSTILITGTLAINSISDPVNVPVTVADAIALSAISSIADPVLVPVTVGDATTVEVSVVISATDPVNVPVSVGDATTIISIQNQVEPILVPVTVGDATTIAADVNISAIADPVIVPVSVIEDLPISLEPETDALLARFTGTYSTEERLAINTLIAGLKADGLWSTIDCLQVYRRAKNSTDALLNWKGTSFTGSTVNNPSFVPAIGFNTNGINNYVNTGFAAASGTNYTRNSASFGTWFYNQTSSGELRIGASHSDSFSTGNLMTIGLGSPPTIAAAINGFTGFPGGTSANGNISSPVNGFLFISRTASNSQYVSYNNQTIGTDSGASQPLTTNTQTIRLGGRVSTNDTMDSAFYRAEHYLFVAASGWNTTQRDNFYARFNSYFVTTELVPTAFSQSSLTSASGIIAANNTNMADRIETTGTRTSSGGNQWIKADLGTAKTVGRIRVSGGSLPITFDSGIAVYLNGAVIQYSTDDVSWTTFANVSGVSDSAPFFSDFTASPVSARYWRLARDPQIATAEFRLFDS